LTMQHDKVVQPTESKGATAPLHTLRISSPSRSPRPLHISAWEQNDQSDDEFNDGASICSVPTSALSLHSSQSDDYFSETASLSSVATSALSLYPTDHAIERMLERGVIIREMQATQKYGKEQVVGKKNRKLITGWRVVMPVYGTNRQLSVWRNPLSGCWTTPSGSVMFINHFSRLSSRSLTCFISHADGSFEIAMGTELPEMENYYKYSFLSMVVSPDHPPCVRQWAAEVPPQPSVKDAPRELLCIDGGGSMSSQEMKALKAIERKWLQSPARREDYEQNVRNAFFCQRDALLNQRGDFLGPLSGRWARVSRSDEARDLFVPSQSRDFYLFHLAAQSCFFLIRIEAFYIQIGFGRILPSNRSTGTPAVPESSRVSAPVTPDLKVVDALANNDVSHMVVQDVKLENPEVCTTENKQAAAAAASAPCCVTQEIDICYIDAFCPPDKESFLPYHRWVLHDSPDQRVIRVREVDGTFSLGESLVQISVLSENKANLAVPTEDPRVMAADAKTLGLVMHPSGVINSLFSAALDVVSAIKWGDLNELNDALDSSSDMVNAFFGDGRTPLIIAAQYGKIAAAQVLLDRGAALDGQRQGHRSNALHYAIQYVQPDMVRYLLDQGLVPDEKAWRHWETTRNPDRTAKSTRTRDPDRTKRDAHAIGQLLGNRTSGRQA
jgi:hypothetical protein